MITQNGFIWWHFRVENETMTFFLQGACAKHSLWLEEIATCVSGLFLASSWLLSVQKSLSILSWIRPTMSALCLLLTVFAASVYSGKIKIYCLSNLDWWSLRIWGSIVGCLDSSECGCSPSDAEIFMLFESDHFLHLIRRTLQLHSRPG